jgi:adenine-specific DNA-methyltransferase
LATRCLAVSNSLSSLYNINICIKPYQAGKGRPPQTRTTVKERPYDSDEQLDSTFRLYLRGKDIARFKIAPLERRYLKYGPWLAEPRPAANFDAPVKLVMRQTGDSLVAALDKEQYLCLNNVHVLVPRDTNTSPLYVLGIINSGLLNWYFHTLNPEIGEALAEVKKTNVARLPVRTIDFSNPDDVARHDRMVELVERMLTLHERLAEAKIDTTDRQIDRLVYALYDLTPEEIEIVEQESRQGG